MNVDIKYLKDEGGNKFSPITDSSSVYNSLGTSLKYINNVQEGVTKIGNWIDGKPIYRKMQTTTFSYSVNTWNQLFSIEDLYCLYRVFGIWNNGKSLFTSPYSGGSGGDLNKIEFITFWFDATQNVLCEKHNYEYVNGCNHFVICEYVANS